MAERVRTARGAQQRGVRLGGINLGSRRKGGAAPRAELGGFGAVRGAIVEDSAQPKTPGQLLRRLGSTPRRLSQSLVAPPVRRPVPVSAEAQTLQAPDLTTKPTVGPLRESMVFLREGLTNFYHTGTLCATSRWAASALTAAINRPHSSPLSILEVGAGTGSVTVRILEDMQEGDSLVICELNPQFMSTLQERLEALPAFQRHRQRVSFFLGAVQDLPETTCFDVIVSALPFLNFDVATVDAIFRKFERVSAPHTVMTYYEYIGLRRLGKLVSPPKRKRRLKELDLYFGERHRESRLSKTRVLRNVLPINIYTLRVHRKG